MPIETLRRYVAEGIPEFDAAYERALCERNQMVELLRELSDALKSAVFALANPTAAGDLDSCAATGTNQTLRAQIVNAQTKAARLLADLEAK